MYYYYDLNFCVDVLILMLEFKCMKSINKNNIVYVTNDETFCRIFNGDYSNIQDKIL